MSSTTPYRGVLGHIELLNATGVMPRELQREFRTVSREAERAAKIVRNLLVFAGSRRLNRRRLSLNAVISRALALRTEACRSAGIDVARNYDAPAATPARRRAALAAGVPEYSD